MATITTTWFSNPHKVWISNSYQSRRYRHLKNLGMSDHLHLISNNSTCSKPRLYKRLPNKPMLAASSISLHLKAARMYWVGAHRGPIAASVGRWALKNILWEALSPLQRIWYSLATMLVGHSSKSSSTRNRSSSTNSNSSRSSIWLSNLGVKWS